MIDALERSQIVDLLHNPAYEGRIAKLRGLLVTAQRELQTVDPERPALVAKAQQKAETYEQVIRLLTTDLRKELDGPEG